MPIEAAAAAARAGDLSFIYKLTPEELHSVQGKVDEDHRSFLHVASCSGDVNLVKYVLENGGKQNLDHADDEGWTPLHSAVSCGHEAVTQLLLAAGACAKQRTAQGRTALHYAASKGAAGVLEELVRHGADVDGRDCTGSTALHRAAGVGRVDVLRILAERCGASLDVKDGQGHTPLAVACLSRHAAAARYLASRGADVEAEDREGETPLSLAALAGSSLRQDLADLALKRKTLADFELDAETA